MLNQQLKPKENIEIEKDAMLQIATKQTNNIEEKQLKTKEVEVEEKIKIEKLDKDKIITFANKTSRLHFPIIIYNIIQDESPDIIKWENNGTSFRICDYHRFENEIVPKYFKRMLFSFI
jgi:hypothetical protein